MKSLILLISFLTVIFLTNCKQENFDQTNIELKIENLDIDSIEYYVSIDGESSYAMWGWKKVGVDSTGYANIEINNSGLNSMLIIVRKDTFRQSINLLFRPKEKYLIKINPESVNAVEISGNFSEAQLAFSKLENTIWGSCGYGHFSIDTVTSNEIIEFLKSEINKELGPFTDLLNAEKIDKKYYSAVKTKIECYNSYKLMVRNIMPGYYKANRLVNGQILTEDFQKQNPLGLEYISLMDTIYKLYSFRKDEALLSLNYFHYLETYLLYKSLNENQLLKIDNDYVENIRIAKKYLTPKEYEYFYAYRLTMLKHGIDTEILIKRFDEFKNEFPESKYIPGIDETIIMLLSYFKNKQ